MEKHEKECTCEFCDDSDLDEMDAMLIILERYSSPFCPQCESTNITRKHLDVSHPFARKLANSEHGFVCNDCKGVW